MAKGKSTYQFNVADPAAAEQIIKQWLATNQFQPQSHDGLVYYRGGDSMVGYQNFEYQFSGNTVTINAYLGGPTKPMLLSDGAFGALQITAYKNKLNEVFTALNSSATNPSSIPTPANASNVAAPTSLPDFQQSIDKKLNTFAEFSFWVSLFMLLISFTGVIYGAIIIIFNYWMAVQGLKSKKRDKAIAAIIISSIAIVVFIVKLIIELNK